MEFLKTYIFFPWLLTECSLRVVWVFKCEVSALWVLSGGGGWGQRCFLLRFSIFPGGERVSWQYLCAAPPGNIQMWIFTQDIAQLTPFLINPAEYRKILTRLLASPINSDQYSYSLFLPDPISYHRRSMWRMFCYVEKKNHVLIGKMKIYGKGSGLWRKNNKNKVHLIWPKTTP